jgi:serine/threonine protein kinase
MLPPQSPKLDGFEFRDYLGGGTFGQVWKALDVKMKVFRAIKVLPRDRFREADARRLLEEAQMMARLPKHRNRVAVHYFKDGATDCFLVMDFISGGALSRMIAPGRPLPWPRAVRYAAGVADALLDVHAHGLLHRDIKPDNILWEPEPDEAVLGDFGIAIAGGQGRPGRRNTGLHRARGLPGGGLTPLGRFLPGRDVIAPGHRSTSRGEHAAGRPPRLDVSSGRPPASPPDKPGSGPGNATGPGRLSRPAPRGPLENPDGPDADGRPE